MRFARRDLQLALAWTLRRVACEAGADVAEHLVAVKNQAALANLFARTQCALETFSLPFMERSLRFDGFYHECVRRFACGRRLPGDTAFQLLR